MPETSQEQFIANVRAALTGWDEPIALPDDMELTRIVHGDKDLVELFCARVDEAKMHAYRVSSVDELPDKIVEVIEIVGAGSAIISTEDLPMGDQIVARLREKGISLCDSDDPDGAFSPEVGITGVRAAIAETPSLCLASGNGRRRLASLAAPCHISVVLAEQIMPDLIDWAVTLPDELQASEVLVSAPSKTADIELNLVMGMHGPKEEHVIVVG